MAKTKEKKGPAKAESLSLDFSKVKETSGFNPVAVDDGDYVAVVKSVVLDKSKEGNKQWVFSISLKDRASAVYPYYCGFGENVLWKIRNLLIAAGLEVPKSKLNVDPNKLVGKEVGIALEVEEYQGKEKSKIMAIFPADDVDEDEDDEPKTKTKKSKAEPAKGKAKAEPVKGKGKKKKSDEDDELDV